MIQYPAQLPLPLQEGYGLSTVDPMLSTQMVTGQARYRIRHSYVPTMVKVNFNFSEKEARLFEGWYVWSIKNGIEWFEITLQTPMGLKAYQAHFSGIYQGPELTQISRWRYSATLQLRERPKPTEDQFLGDLIDMPLGQFNADLQDVLEKWHTRYFG